MIKLTSDTSISVMGKHDEIEDRYHPTEVEIRVNEALHDDSENEDDEISMSSSCELHTRCTKFYISINCYSCY